MATIIIFIIFVVLMSLLIMCAALLGDQFLGGYTLILQIIAVILSYVLFFSKGVGSLVYKVLCFFDKFFPGYPPCESGCCRYLEDYTEESRDWKMNTERPQWSILTCKCGHKYSYIQSAKAGHRVFKMDSEGNETPYMKLTWLCRWVKDDNEEFCNKKYPKEFCNKSSKTGSLAPFLKSKNKDEDK